MEFRQIGNTDLRCSVITFGAWAIGGWMWGGTDRKKSIEAIRASYDAGVTTIDTAPAYGSGLSEELVKEAVAEIPREKVQILTKFGIRWDVQKGALHMKGKDLEGKELILHRWASKEGIMKECEDSLRRLGTDYIDLYQIHWPDVTTPVAETMEAMLRLKEQGKIRAIGVCNYSVELMKEAEQTAELASDQVPYSMLLRDIEKQLVPYCLDNHKSIIAYSPLQRGILTGKMKSGHKFDEGDHRAGLKFYTDENIQRVNSMLDTLKSLAESKNATLAQLVLRWTIDQPGITIALAGARNAEQAIQNARAADIVLNNDELDFIHDQVESLDLISA